MHWPFVGAKWEVLTKMLLIVQEKGQWHWAEKEMDKCSVGWCLPTSRNIMTWRVATNVIWTQVPVLFRVLCELYTEAWQACQNTSCDSFCLGSVFVWGWNVSCCDDQLFRFYLVMSASSTWQKSAGLCVKSFYQSQLWCMHSYYL